MRASLSLAFLSLVAAGCSSSSNAEAPADTGAGDTLADTLADTDAPPTGFGCVGSVAWPDAPAATATVSFKYLRSANDLSDPNDRQPYAGATIEACAKGSDCATPLATATTGTDGVATMTVPTPGMGFEGYFFAHGSDVMPIRWTYLPPIADADSRWLRADNVPVVFTANALQALATKLGVTLSSAKGHVITTTIDCDGNLRSDVKTTLGGVEANQRLAADAIFFDVTPGSVELVATLDADGRVIARGPLPVTAGAVTAISFGPTPLP